MRNESLAPQAKSATWIVTEIIVPADQTLKAAARMRISMTRMDASMNTIPLRIGMVHFPLER